MGTALTIFFITTAAFMLGLFFWIARINNSVFDFMRTHDELIPIIRDAIRFQWIRLECLEYRIEKLEKLTAQLLRENAALKSQIDYLDGQLNERQAGLQTLKQELITDIEAMRKARKALDTIT